jgi:hypothetical protein
MTAKAMAVNAGLLLLLLVVALLLLLLLLSRTLGSVEAVRQALDVLSFVSNIPSMRA